MKEKLSPPAPQAPDFEAVSREVNSPLWDALCAFLQECYGVSPQLEYSKCAMAMGWNVKYRRGGRALCTLYPDRGTFTCMISVGKRETPEVELILDRLTPYVQELYRAAKPYQFGRWLMIQVTAPEILADVKTLLLIREKPKGKK